MLKHKIKLLPLEKIKKIIIINGKILTYEFYPKAAYFEYKCWISRSAITRVQN